MADTLDKIFNLPDISFVDDLTLRELQTELITAFCEKYEEITGEKISLKKADPNRIILLAVAQYLYQGLLQIDRAGKMNFLKYSYGNYLRNLAALKGVEVKPAKQASVQMAFSLEEARDTVTSIPAGTRVTADWETFFAVRNYAEIPAGDTSVTVTADCTEAGSKGNGFILGEITTLVDPLPMITAVTNTDTSAGGMDEESDESLLERVYLAPSGYSVAGSEAAYIYHAKSFDPKIGDIKVTCPSPGVVDLRFIMSDGSLPSSSKASALLAYLSANNLRPLTDNVQAGAPTQAGYNIELTYYIRQSDLESEQTIKDAADKAIADYQLWQKSRIGRAINPDELISRLIAAGVKRVELTAPEYTEIDSDEVAACNSVSVTYGGLESD